MAFVTTDPIDPVVLLEEVMGPDRGGTAMFLGTVRCGPDDGPVEAIDYSGYREMVEAEFGRIADEATTRWPDARVTGRHRLGEIPLGEASIAIVAAAPHRIEALEACRYVLEECKQRLPVWKRERLADGTERWREGEGTAWVSPSP